MPAQLESPLIADSRDRLIEEINWSALKAALNVHEKRDGSRPFRFQQSFEINRKFLGLSIGTATGGCRGGAVSGVGAVLGAAICRSTPLCDGH